MYFKKYFVVYREILKQVQNDIDYLKKIFTYQTKINRLAEFISASHNSTIKTKF